SIGMNSAELASFMITQLGAAAGATLDGGGSSAMWIQGRGIVNVPSDGSERATTNGLMMFAAEPREQSTLFQTSDPVVTSAATVMRLGPGTNFDVLANVPAGAPGAITAHGLNGVQATGTHWWRWAWNGVEGWTPEGALLEPLAAQGWVYR
ncbi:MAG: phosphodiester glycosidase family protein, partial [Candidatus Sumerlaeia bacterium]|nr:phosphodiester glycosidase family protein [Candidatus Sumerlaeia bacterium]